MPTKQQIDKITSLQLKGWKWNKDLSISYAAVVLSKNKDIYVFGLDGSISLNP